MKENIDVRDHQILILKKKIKLIIVFILAQVHKALCCSITSRFYLCKMRGKFSTARTGLASEDTFRTELLSVS